MRHWLMLMASVALAGQSPGFEKIALVDSLDFCTHFDVETKEGTVGVIDHVLRSHPTALWWRDKGGGLMRYPSAAEGNVMSESPFDRRRVPCEAVTGWLRMDRGVRVFPTVKAECARRKLGYGIHTTWEETHRSGWALSNWTIAHPEYWGCRPDGKPWMGCCALAHPEVRAHKLQLVNERLALGGDTIFLDLWRRGEWSPAREYVRPSIEDWTRANGCAPPKDPSDPRWLKHVSGYVHDYLRQFARRCHARGVRFVIGLPIIDCADTDVWRLYALDWKLLAREGTLDGVAIHYVRTDWSDPWGSTRRIYEYVVANRGRADIYFPVSAYNHEHTGIPAYCQKTGLSDGEVTKRLYELAKDCGAAGVILDCVDYANYTPAMNAALADTRKIKGETK